MKKFVFLFFAALFYSNTVFALKCASPKMMQDKATNVYLVEIKSIYNITYLDCSIKANGEIEVLKVYKGDAEVLSKNDKIYFSVSGDDVWGPKCDSLIFDYKEGENWLLFDNDTSSNISRGMCGGYNIKVDGFILKSFEEKNKPIWIREK